MASDTSEGAGGGGGARGGSIFDSMRASLEEAEREVEEAEEYMIENAPIFVREANLLGFYEYIMTKRGEYD